MACVPAHRRGRTVTSILRVGTKGNTVCSDPAGLALLMASVPCVPKSAASCLDSRSLTPSHCQGPRPYSGSLPEGGACSPKWAGLGRAHLVLFLHKGSALHPLQGPVEAGALSLRLAGNSQLLASVGKEGGSSSCSREVVSESETRSKCVGSHDASSGLGLRNGEI